MRSISLPAGSGAPSQRGAEDSAAGGGQRLGGLAAGLQRRKRLTAARPHHPRQSRSSMVNFSICQDLLASWSSQPRLGPAALVEGDLAGPEVCAHLDHSHHFHCPGVHVSSGRRPDRVVKSLAALVAKVQMSRTRRRACVRHPSRLAVLLGSQAIAA